MGGDGGAGCVCIYVYGRFKRIKKQVCVKGGVRIFMHESLLLFSLVLYTSTSCSPLLLFFSYCF